MKEGASIGEGMDPRHSGRGAFRRRAVAGLAALLVLFAIFLHVRTAVQLSQARRAHNDLVAKHNELVRNLNRRFAAEARAREAAAAGDALSALGVPGGKLIGTVLSGLAGQGAPPAKAWLGAGFKNLKGGAGVTSVAPGSPAEAAGLRVGDLVVEFDGRSIHSKMKGKAALALTRMVGSRDPGARVRMVVQRPSARVTLTATLAAPPSRGRSRGTRR